MAVCDITLLGIPGAELVIRLTSVGQPLALPDR
jgi:hypothetical protein